MFSSLFKPKDTRAPDEKVREKEELLTEQYADMKESIKANIREVKHQIRSREWS